MNVMRPPRPSLLPFLRLVWCCDSRPSGGQERCLPTGEMHVALRLGGPRIRIAGEEFGWAVAAGARNRFYSKDCSAAICSVGAILQPGAARAVFGVPAPELAGRHVTLSDLWGQQASEALERVQEPDSAQERLQRFEDLVAARLPQVKGVHPAVAAALARFAEGWAVREVVAETGYSHRRFVEIFREATGLGPKEHCRVQRFRQALGMVHAGRELADVAAGCGYSDQAHFTREFRNAAGTSPGAYRAARVNFVQDITPVLA
ncbi:MAG: AraC family transcriptional regulator [Bryobacteraceae bacterium]|nr:AraC family transcriptional regulator [Bryobacteraceae bacterium]